MVLYRIWFGFSSIFEDGTANEQHEKFEKTNANKIIDEGNTKEASNEEALMEQVPKRSCANDEKI